MTKNQIRQNIVTKEWVIYSPERGSRPKDFKENSGKRDVPEHDNDCPFCSGNESELGEILLSLSFKGGKNTQTKVIPNKFPALIPDENTNRTSAEEFYIRMQGYGRHEVIIENPYHNRDLAVVKKDEMEVVIETYHKRYLTVMKDQENLFPVIFRNHGKKAGTSLIHPHSQLIVTGFVPNHVRRRELEAQHYHDEWGRCVYCDVLNHELKEDKRIIMQTDSMVTFIPFAAEVPFETWIIPVKHQTDFGLLNEKEKEDLAVSLKFILNTFFNKLEDPDYNFIINTSARYEAGEPHLHWYLQIRPRITTTAGFEIGSGISINPSIPEEDAKYLKS